KQEKTSYFESSCRTKDGMLIPVEINANYLSYEDKEFIVGFCRDIRQRKLSEERLKRQIDRLAALRAIDMAITASLDMRVTFSIFLEQVINNLHVDAADVLVLNSHSFNKLTFVAGRGFRTNALRYTNLSIGEGFAGRVAQERKTICIPDLEKEAQDLLKISPQISSEDFVAYYGAPLIAKGQVKGVLEIFNRTPLEPDQEWLDFLEALATQAAIAADNAMLFDDLQKSNLDLLQAYDSTLEGWSNALDLRDRETEGHSQRVTEMTLRMARQMGMRDSELAHVRRGALLHDIGKMGIPDGILLKPGPLDDEEWEIMRKHPVYAYELLYPITYLRPAVDIPYSHHEKWDGTGYPRGLKGVHIPLAARIFAIVDVWDALRSDRPYRPAWPEEKTREHIREQTGKQFDPKVVEVFLELLNEFKPV
ncbi:MAG: HD domain-containing protein, partial [Proteobacteria bacterium]|nr:HD domain-containing protein [Pseudomonadota bacterium]